MRNYIATFTDSNGKVIQQKNFEANNLKEANIQAQQFKKTNPSIKKAGRVKTLVEISEEDQREMVLKSLERGIKENEKLQRDYEKYKSTFSKDEQERLKDFFE